VRTQDRRQVGLIHPSVWKVNSPKFASRILHRPTPSTPERAIHLRNSTDPTQHIVVSDKDAKPCMRSGKTPRKSEPDHQHNPTEAGPSTHAGSVARSDLSLPGSSRHEAPRRFQGRSLAPHKLARTTSGLSAIRRAPCGRRGSLARSGNASGSHLLRRPSRSVSRKDKWSNPFGGTIGKAKSPHLRGFLVLARQYSNLRPSDSQSTRVDPISSRRTPVESLEMPDSDG
jgi:hypothetical protein